MPTSDPIRSDLRIALFSGNYNMVKDGANQALNRLVEYFLRHGAAVRVYSPTVETPAFASHGDVVSLPSFAIPGRPEYRWPLPLTRGIRRDLEEFAPNIVHLSSPDWAARGGQKWAAGRGIPVVLSVHTQFEAYLGYYGLSIFKPLLVAYIRELYQKCDVVLAPTQVSADDLRAQSMSDRIGIWSRGVDRAILNPARRDMAWRRDIGIADDEFVIGWLGRLVLEKGVERFCETLNILKSRGVPHRALIVGDGPARELFESLAPGAIFLGFQTGTNLARAVASMDVLVNPSKTEVFGNVTLEGMACGLPVVAADAAGTKHLVDHDVHGLLVPATDVGGYADALERYIADPALRARHAAAGAARADEFSWEGVNHGLAKDYRALIAPKSGY
jgi:phosphatidylinositol alpha 1,6-mannosyltransferase